MVNLKKISLISKNNTGDTIAMLTHDAGTVNMVNMISNQPDSKGMCSFKVNNKIVKCELKDLYMSETKLYTKFTLTEVYEKERGVNELDVLYKMLNYDDETQFFGLINNKLKKDEKDMNNIFANLPYETWVNDNADDIIREHRSLFTRKRIEEVYNNFYSNFILKEYNENSLSLFYSESFRAIKLMLLHDYIYCNIRYNKSDYDIMIRILIGSITKNHKVAGGNIAFLRPIIESNMSNFGLPGYLAINAIETALRGEDLLLPNGVEAVILRRNDTITQLGLNTINPYQNIDYTFGESYFTQNGENLINTIQSSMVISNVVNKTPLENPIELTSNPQGNLISNVNVVDLRTINYVELANEYQAIRDEIEYLPTRDAKIELLFKCKDLINKIRLAEKEYIVPNMNEDEDSSGANELSILANKVSETADEIANINVYYGAGENKASVTLSYEMIQLKNVFIGPFKAFKNTMLTFWKTPLNEIKKATNILRAELRILFNVLFPIKSVTKGTVKEIKKAAPVKESFNYTKVNLIALCEEMNNHIKYLTKEEGNLYIPSAEGLDVIFNLKKGQLALIVNAVLTGIKISKSEKHILALQHSIVSAIEEVLNKIDDDKYKAVLNDSIKKINQVTEDRLKKVQSGKK